MRISDPRRTGDVGEADFFVGPRCHCYLSAAPPTEPLEEVAILMDPVGFGKSGFLCCWDIFGDLWSAAQQGRPLYFGSLEEIPMVPLTCQLNNGYWNVSVGIGKKRRATWFASSNHHEVKWRIWLKFSDHHVQITPYPKDPCMIYLPTWIFDLW